MPKLTRRALPNLAAALALFAIAPATIAPATITPAYAQGKVSVTDATSFVRRTGDRFVAIVNGPGSAAQRQKAMEPVIDQVVDVNGVARFVLGRFWRTATPAQQQEYLNLFRQVLNRSITGRLGEYQGVNFAVGGAEARADGVHVATTITRPNNPPTQVEWVVEDVGGQPKIVDVIAEGTSLRITQRSDYASFLASHGDSIDALLKAMQRQLRQSQ